jgi:hypothetical protein
VASPRVRLPNASARSPRFHAAGVETPRFRPGYPQGIVFPNEPSGLRRARERDRRLCARAARRPRFRPSTSHGNEACPTSTVAAVAGMAEVSARLPVYLFETVERRSRQHHQLRSRVYYYILRARVRRYVGYGLCRLSVAAGRHRFGQFWYAFMLRFRFFLSLSTLHVLSLSCTVQYHSTRVQFVASFKAYG